MISNLDHLVPTVGDIEKTVEFYTDVLGMEKEIVGEERVALKRGSQKINLHQTGKEFEPKAAHPSPFEFRNEPEQKRWVSCFRRPSFGYC